MHLQRPHGRYDDGGAGVQTGLAALDVEEFLGPQVGSEARLGHDIVGQLERGLGGDDGVTTVGNIGKRSAVDDGWIVFQGLNDIGLECVFE